MILVLILFIPVAGGLLAWLSERAGEQWPRRVSALSLLVDFALSVYLWFASITPEANAGPWIREFNVPWVPPLGMSFHLAADGITVVLVALTAFLGCAANLASWSEIRERKGFFSLCYTWTLAGVFGVFLAVDLFLFYFAWELMLVPMFFMIALWGHEDRFRAAVKFFIFTQISGLFMLVSILGLYSVHGSSTGAYTFDYTALLNTPVQHGVAMLLLLGFLAAFLVKLPAVPFHTWLPDAHTQAPTAGSVILAGLLLKTGAYGLIRFAIPLFPAQAQELSILPAILGVTGILYGAILAFAQTDLKRLIAYTSVSHMGFVLLGIFAGNDTAFKGALLQIVAHGLSTGALFILVGALQERIGTRELGRMGGLWGVVPRFGGVWMFFALASLGLPGLGNFVGEFMVVLGTYQENGPLAVAAAFGFVLSTVYSLWMVQRAFFGENRHGWSISDLSLKEMGVMTAIIIPLLWLGLYPQPFIRKADEASLTVRKAAVVKQAGKMSGVVSPRSMGRPR
ncbi:MAG: NADH-quinone oxidoreductase subunit M [Syntrophorhabdaceae bacterium PtaU1.Bin034]|nr:MAG: NADH-quinone oxidoreductase subunit M [Syntrophorhabdaceae bacterium PtaU1.Bin034]